MQCNQETRFEVRGPTVIIKDAMIMLSVDVNEPEWPSVECATGKYVVEVYVPQSFNAHRVRFRLADSTPEAGSEIDSVGVDYAFIAFVDYRPFFNAVSADFEAYEEWDAWSRTMNSRSSSPASSQGWRVFSRTETMKVASRDTPAKPHWRDRCRSASAWTGMFCRR